MYSRPWCESGSVRIRIRPYLVWKEFPRRIQNIGATGWTRCLTHSHSMVPTPELGTRQRDLVFRPKFFIYYCIMALFGVATPFKHRDLNPNQNGMPADQGWEFAHSLTLIHSFAHHSLTHLLIAHSLIGSFCSNKMSDCERFAQIAQDK